MLAQHGLLLADNVQQALSSSVTLRQNTLERPADDSSFVMSSRTFNQSSIHEEEKEGTHSNQSLSLSGIRANNHVNQNYSLSK